MEDTINELTLLLLYLTSWDEEGIEFDENDIPDRAIFKRSFKGYPFDSLNELTDKGYLFQSSYKSKSVTLTTEGIQMAKKVLEKYLNNW